MAEEQVKNRLEQDSIGKLMLELCTQTTLSIMIYNIYTITDTFYVSKGIGSVASGAIGIFSPVLLLVNGVSSTLGTGGASIISRRLGERNPASGEKVVGCMMWLWVLCSLTITITGLAFLEPLLKLLGSTYAVISRIQSFLSTPFSGIMQGIQPMLGFDWGRQQRKRVKRTVAYAILGGVIYGGVIAVCVYCGSGAIVKLFSVDSEITSIGKTALQIICFSLVIGGIMPVIQAYFLALGYGKKVLFLSLESIFAIRLPLLLIAWRLDNLDIIWWILVLTEWLIAGLAVYNYKIVRKER